MTWIITSDQVNPPGGAAAVTAYDNLIIKGWTIAFNA